MGEILKTPWSKHSALAEANLPLSKGEMQEFGQVGFLGIQPRVGWPESPRPVWGLRVEVNPSKEKTLLNW